MMVTVLTICKLGFKFRVIWEDTGKDEKERTYEIDLFEDFLLPCGLLLAAALMIVRINFHLASAEYLIGVYVGVCVFLHWRRIGKYFSSLTHYAEQNKMRK